MSEEKIEQGKYSEVVQLVVREVNDVERTDLIRWAEELTQIRESNLSIVSKTTKAIQLTLRSNVIWPAIRRIAIHLKRFGWDERSWSTRLGGVGILGGLIAFAGQGAGIAALGGAIGVPLWIILGAGGTFLGTLLQELTNSRDKP